MDYDKNNTFAKILRGEIPAIKVYEDMDTLAFMDLMPQAKGHVLVIPKEPVQYIYELSTGAAAALMVTTQRVAQALTRSLNPPGLMVAQLNGEPAGQTIFHVHFHIIPRWPGIELGPHAKRPVDPAELEPVAEKIRRALHSQEG